MDQPLWHLPPWLVFAVGIGFKTWKVTRRLLNRQLPSSVWGGGTVPRRAGAAPAAASVAALRLS
jgi:hypothetical protein